MSQPSGRRANRQCFVSSLCDSVSHEQTLGQGLEMQSSALFYGCLTHWVGESVSSSGLTVISKGDILVYSCLKILPYLRVSCRLMLTTSHKYKSFEKSKTWNIQFLYLMSDMLDKNISMAEYFSFIHLFVSVHIWTCLPFSLTRTFIVFRLKPFWLIFGKNVMLH